VREHGEGAKGVKKSLREWQLHGGLMHREGEKTRNAALTEQESLPPELGCLARTFP
jgi:hypothetical protein